MASSCATASFTTKPRLSKPWGSRSKTLTPTPEPAGYCVRDVDGERSRIHGCITARDVTPVESLADHKNASHYCKAVRDFLGDAKFSQRYTNHGKCISSSQ